MHTDLWHQARRALGDRFPQVFAHLTGKDVWAGLVDTQDIVPVSETPENINKEVLWKVSLYSGKQKSFYICTKYGGVLSNQRFADIFGEEFEESNNNEC